MAPMRSFISSIFYPPRWFFGRWALLILGARFSSCLRDHQNWGKFCWLFLNHNSGQRLSGILLEGWAAGILSLHIIIDWMQHVWLVDVNFTSWGGRLASCSEEAASLATINASVSAGITCSINFSYQRTHCLSDDVIVDFVIVQPCSLGFIYKYIYISILTRLIRVNYIQDIIINVHTLGVTGAPTGNTKLALYYALGCMDHVTRNNVCTLSWENGSSYNCSFGPIRVIWLELGAANHMMYLLAWSGLHLRGVELQCTSVNWMMNV